MNIKDTIVKALHENFAEFTDDQADAVIKALNNAGYQIHEKRSSKAMSELSPAEIELLEEFREDLAPRHVSGMFYTATLPAELITALYKVLDEKMATADGLPAAVKRSLKEVS